jgi:ABC-type transporter Mla subunit MlaD
MPGPDPASARLAEAAAELERLREQAADLLRQQEALSDSVRNLVQVGVLGSEQSREQLEQLEQTLRRIEEHLARITTPRPR